jgi:hypothetical protein
MARNADQSGFMPIQRDDGVDLRGSRDGRVLGSRGTSKCTKLLLNRHRSDAVTAAFLAEGTPKLSREAKGPNAPRHGPTRGKASFGRFERGSTCTGPYDRLKLT